MFEFRGLQAKWSVGANPIQPPRVYCMISLRPLAVPPATIATTSMPKCPQMGIRELGRGKLTGNRVLAAGLAKEGG
jgi:hypothetical protein